MKRIKLFITKTTIATALSLIFVVCSVFGILAFIANMYRDGDNALRIARGFDQTVNAALNGSEDETISSRMGKKIEKGECKPCMFICYLLSFLDPDDGNHCIIAIERDE